MCRLAAFPPGFERTKALEILLAFEKHNTDGTGCVYIKDKQFVTERYPIALNKALKKHPNFLTHMPHNGWTLVHIRAASHGKNLVRNTHPFIVNDWAVIHNGVWSEYNVVKLAIEKTRQIHGETDSEVAAHLIDIAGPKKFTEEVDHGGVFFALKKNGELHVSKTSGDLMGFEMDKDVYLLASELSCVKYHDAYKISEGWFKFSPEGKFVKQKKKEMPDRFAHLRPTGGYTSDNKIINDNGHYYLPNEVDAEELIEEQMEEQEAYEEYIARTFGMSRNEYRELNALQERKNSERSRAELERSLTPPRPSYYDPHDSEHYWKGI